MLARATALTAWGMSEPVHGVPPFRDDEQSVGPSRHWSLLRMEIIRAPSPMSMCPIPNRVPGEPGEPEPNDSAAQERLTRSNRRHRRAHC